MNFLLQIAFGIFLVVLQTTEPGRSLPVLSRCDLFIPLVLYSGLFRPLREGLAVVLFCGAAMDVFSGAPPGFFLVIYLWLFTAGRWLPRYLHADNILFLIAFCAVGAFFREAFLLGSAVILHGASAPWRTAAPFLAKAALYGALAGPVVLTLMEFILEREAKRRARRERLA